MRTRPLALVAAVALAATPLGAQEVKTEVEKLQGEWVMVSMELQGRKSAEDYVKKSKLVVKGEEWLQTLNGQEQGKKTIKIDPSKDPKEIDFTTTTDADAKAARTTRGIYKLDGDSLTLCRQIQPEKKRPKEFKAADGGVELLVFKRAEKK